MSNADLLSQAVENVEARGFLSLAEASRILLQPRSAVNRAVVTLGIQPLRATDRFFLISVADMNRLKAHFSRTDADVVADLASPDLVNEAQL